MRFAKLHTNSYHSLEKICFLPINNLSRLTHERMNKDMNNKVRVGVLASLLVAPATLASANEQAPIVQQSEQQPFNVLANLSEREILLQQFITLQENSTSQNIVYARTAFNNLTPEQEALLEADEYDLLEAKLEYIEKHVAIIEDLKKLKADIDKLVLTSPTLIADVSQAREDYDEALADLAAAQLAVNNAFNTAPASVLKSSLVYAGNLAPDNIVLLQKTVTNAKLLEDREKEIVKPQAFIVDYVDDLQNLDKASYKEVIANAKAAYEALNANEKKIIAAHIVKDDVTAYQLLKNAENFLKAVDEADQLYKTILTTNYTSVGTLKSKMKDLEAAIVAVGEDYDLYLELPHLAELRKVLTVVEAIDGLKVEQYRSTEEGNDETALEKVVAAFNEIDPQHQYRVFNGDKLQTAIADVEVADAVDALIDALLIEEPATLQAATQAYNKLTTTQKKLVEKLEVLQAFQQDNKSAAAVVKMIDELKPTLSTSYLSRLRAADVSYKKLQGDSAEPNEAIQHVLNYPILVNLLQFEPVIDKVVSLKLPKSVQAEVEAYETNVQEARTAYETALAIPIAADDIHKEALEALLKAANDRLTIAEYDIARAKSIGTAIEDLKTSTSNELLNKISIARSLYDEKYATTETTFTGTSSNAKKLVYNYSELSALEKQYTTVLKVTNSIAALPSYYAKTSLLSRIQSAQKAYDGLGATMQGFVHNKADLDALAPVAAFMQDVNALKPKDANYEANVKRLLNTDYPALKANFAADKDLTDMLEDKYVSKLETAIGNIDTAAAVIGKITALQGKTGQTVGDDIADIKAEYKKVKQKNLVTNYAEFQAIEKNYKAANKVIKLIADLPIASRATAKDYAKKVEAAKKAYDKLTTAQNVYVFNYLDLSSVVQSAKVIGMIADLKVTSKDYLTDLAAAKEAYAALSTGDQSKVVNAHLLDEGDAMRGTVESVEALIAAAIPSASDYINKLIEARQGYDSLAKNEQRLVSNYKDLTTREKAVKPVLTLTENIAALDPSNATKFISQYKSAIKAHEKLSFADRALVANEQRLITELAPIFKVMEQISLIKESSKTFVEDVTKARAAYNALSAGDKAQISNYARLLEQELNVQGGARVDEMIRSIKSSNPKDYVANVKAARAAYNSLSSANKKGVTLLNELKAEESYIKPVETVIDLIDGLFNPRNDMAKQVTKIQKALAKLNNEQQSFVTNMADYTDLASVVHVYDLIEKLKPSDKYYIGNLQAARTAYEKLSPEEKMRVTNYYKLQEAITNVEGVENVISTIASLSSSSSTYFDDVAKASDLYKALPSALKKQVHNYDILKNAEKSIKNAQKVITTIDQIDPTVRTFESKVKAARKAYDRLTAEEKILVINYTFLTRYELELGL